MSNPDRHRRARNLCRRLTEDVTAMSPIGLGSWLPDKHPVHTASQDFLDTLAAWEREEGTVDQVREAYDATLQAWRQAAEVFRSQGKEGAIPHDAPLAPDTP